MVLVEYPVLAMTGTGEILGWRDESQNNLSLRHLGDGQGYRINREREELKIGEGEYTREDQLKLASDPDWDLRGTDPARRLLASGQQSSETPLVVLRDHRAGGERSCAGLVQGQRQPTLAGAGRR